METILDIKKRFSQHDTQKIPYITAFIRSVRGMQYEKEDIISAFEELVPKDEYESSDKEELIRSFLVATQEFSTT